MVPILLGLDASGASCSSIYLNCFLRFREEEEEQDGAERVGVEVHTVGLEEVEVEGREGPVESLR